jgi:hypothetical protein
MCKYIAFIFRQAANAYVGTIIIWPVNSSVYGYGISSGALLLLWLLPYHRGNQ